MNIVLCCDGTGHELFGDPTNVLRLYYALDRSTPEQRTFYNPGIGTLPFASRWARLSSLAFGKGIHADISALYSFLVREYKDGDKIFLFGFSRGAFTVRAVAAVVHQYGVLRRDHEHLSPHLVSSMASLSAGRLAKPNTQSKVYGSIAAVAEIKALISRPARVWFVGAWDTVLSVGSIWNPWSLPFIVSNPSIDIARHAIAIDERRALFRPVLWRE